MRSLSWPTRWVGSPLRVLLIVVYSVLTFMSIISFITQRTVYEAITTVVVACAALFHPAHREFCTAIIGASFFLFLLTPPGIVPVSTAVAVFYITYLVSAYSPPKWRKIWLPVIIAGVMLAIVTDHTFVDVYAVLSSNSPADLSRLQLYIMMVFASLIGLGFFWLLGLQRRRQDADRQALKDRAELAAVVERTRIAREMHDIVAHSLSSIITQADGARYASAAARQASEEATDADGSQPETSQKIAEQTLDTIATTARGSLAQMRSLLGILRTDEVTMYTPAPSLGEVPMLVEQTRDSGVPIEFSGISGVPRGTLPQGAELAAYRVVQEALTNILKHARDAQQVQLVVAWDRAGLGISAHNSAPQGKFSPVPGSGNGLRGMAERVNMYEGELSYGPDVQGGYTVRAHLPYREI